MCLFCGRSPLELLKVISKPARVERATALPPALAVAAARMAAHALRDAIIQARWKQKRLFCKIACPLLLVFARAARHGSEERDRRRPLASNPQLLKLRASESEPETPKPLSWRTLLGFDQLVRWSDGLGAGLGREKGGSRERVREGGRVEKKCGRIGLGVLRTIFSCTYVCAACAHRTYNAHSPIGPPRPAKESTKGPSPGARGRMENASIPPADTPEETVYFELCSLSRDSLSQKGSLVL